MAAQHIIRIGLAVLGSGASLALSWPYWRNFEYWAESSHGMWQVYFVLGFVLAVYVFYAFLGRLTHAVRARRARAAHGARSQRNRRMPAGRTHHELRTGQNPARKGVKAAPRAVRARPDGAHLPRAVGSLVRRHARADAAVPQSATPVTTAVDGKRVFQAYNCMGCHTIVGNGAYFGPDLTQLYGKVGPCLAGGVPALGRSVADQRRRRHAAAQRSDRHRSRRRLDRRLPAKYPAAAERIARRGAHAIVDAEPAAVARRNRKLIAFLKYTSAMNTEGWPPKPRVDGLAFAYAKPMPASLQTASTATQPASAAHGQGTAGATVSEAAHGEQVARDTGCIACHSSGSQRLVGPGWADLYGSGVALRRRQHRADEAYLKESIVDPDARVVAGFAPHLMPSYAGVLDEGQIAAVVAYIRSLAGESSHDPHRIPDPAPQPALLHADAGAVLLPGRLRPAARPPSTSTPRCSRAR
jgi:cytochrome c2